ARIISTTCSLKLASKTLRFDFVTFIFSGDFHLSVCTKLLDQDKLSCRSGVQQGAFTSLKAYGFRGQGQR
ncbi:hypothetical protein, partial [Rhodoferax ferrireducens]|uniref:hypothetical protein n=1 Tax=Rhodoferax ferrireducens TaxID=192843 RepID=UPI001E5CC7E2